MRSEIHNLRENQELSVKFVANILNISEEEYEAIENKSFDELTQYEKTLFARLFGVDEADLKPYTPSPQVISIVGGAGPAALMKEIERILIYREKMNKNNK